MNNFVPVSWHPFGDPFTTSEAIARADYYNVTFSPICVFDGKYQIIGGSSTTYNEYMDMYNARRAVSSPLTITYLAKSYAGDHASVKVKVKLEQNISGTNKVYIILWEDDCFFDDRYFCFVERRQPSPTTLTISQAGEEQTIKKTFTLGDSWNKNHLGVSTLVQKQSDKSILNGRAVRLVQGVPVEPHSLGRVKALFY